MLVCKYVCMKAWRRTAWRSNNTYTYIRTYIHTDIQVRRCLMLQFQICVPENEKLERKKKRHLIFFPVNHGMHQLSVLLPCISLSLPLPVGLRCLSFTLTPHPDPLAPSRRDLSPSIYLSSISHSVVYLAFSCNMRKRGLHTHIRFHGGRRGSHFNCKRRAWDVWRRGSRSAIIRAWSPPFCRAVANPKALASSAVSSMTIPHKWAPAAAIQRKRQIFVFRRLYVD